MSERKPSLTGSGLLVDGNKPPVKRVSFSNTHSVINADSGEELVHVRHRDSITSASTDSSEDSTSSGEGKMTTPHRSKMRPKLPVTTGTTKQISEMVQSSFDNMTYECLMEEDWQPAVTSPVRKEFERRKSAPAYNASDIYSRCDGHENLPMSPTSPRTCSPQHLKGGKMPSQSQRMTARSHSRGSSISSVESSDSYQSQGSCQSHNQGQCFSPTGVSHSYDGDQVASPSPLYETIAPPLPQGQGQQIQKQAPPTAAKPVTGKKLRPQSTPSAGPQEPGHRRTSSKSSLESVEEIPRAEEPMITQSTPFSMVTTHAPATPTRGQYMKTPPPPPPVAKQTQPHLKSTSQPSTPTLNISAAQYHQTHSEPQLYGLDSPVDCFPTPAASQAPIPMSPPVGPSPAHVPMSPPSATSSMSSPMSPRPSVHRHPSFTATPVSPPITPPMPHPPLATPSTPPLVPPTPRNPNTVVKTHKRRPSGDQRVIDGSQPMSRSLGSDYPDIAMSRPPIVMLSELPLPSPSRMTSEGHGQGQGHDQFINNTEENNYAPLPFMAELNKHMHKTPHNGDMCAPGSKQPPEKLPKPSDKRLQINKQPSPVPSMCSSQPNTAMSTGGLKSQLLAETKKTAPPPPPRRSESTKLTSNTRTSSETKSVPKESESIYGNCDGLLDINDLPPPPPELLEGYARDSSIKTGSGKGRPPPPPPPKRNKDTQISSSSH